MTRVQLVSKLALRLDVTKKEANLYLTVFLDSIMEKNLQNDGRVVVQGFGSFKVNEYKARVAKKTSNRRVDSFAGTTQTQFSCGYRVAAKSE